MTETSTPDEWPVHCPFARAGECPSEPPCPTQRERICINGLDDE